MPELDSLELKVEADVLNLLSGGTIDIQAAKICSMIPKDAFTHNEYMELCMLLLSKCDYIYLMKGWEESAGANIEYGYAVAADKIILKE